MHAVVARAGKVSVETVEDPTPGSGEVLVAPLACGICGSDLHTLEMQASMPDAILPMILGHEFVGEILDYGPDTERRHKRGTIVTSVPYLDTTSGPQLLGLSPVAGGGLAERMLLQEHRLVVVTPNLSPTLAAFTEPLAVGAHAVAAAQMQKSDAALVIGCGPVGLAVIAALKAAGHGPVVASDFSAERRRLAEDIGADVVVDANEASPYAAWTELAGPALPPSPLWTHGMRAGTVVFECVGVPGVLNTVMQSVRPHTRIVVVGVCQQPDTITPATGIINELSLRFVFAYRPEEFAQALDWIATGKIDVAPLITDVLPLNQVSRAFAELAPPSTQCKIMLTPVTSLGA